MSHLCLKQKENLSIQLSHMFKAGEQRKLDLYFSLPKDMGIGPQSLHEDEFYFSAISSSRSYFSDCLHLPLVQSRFISQNRRTLEEFKLYINMFSYQFVLAMENDATELLNLDDPDIFYPLLNELTVQAAGLMKKFRRNEPEEMTWKHYFSIVDNYLSWFCEQTLLKLQSRAPQKETYLSLMKNSQEFCRTESKHRADKNYNSEQTVKDPNRIANKMLLLRRVIQQGVVLKTEVKALGAGLKKLATGIATTFIMLIVTSLIFKAQGVLSGVTIALVIVLAIIYAARETFKEDVSNALWRFIRRGRPHWSNIFWDSHNNNLVAKQLVWLSFMKEKELPKTVADIFQQRHSQNKVESEILHYGTNTKVAKVDFLTGYDKLQEQVVFSLAPFARYLERGKAEIYSEIDGEIKNETVERRYQINLVAVLQNGAEAAQYTRYKITMNRSQIVDISVGGIPVNLLKIESKSHNRSAVKAGAEFADKHRDKIYPK